MRSYQSSTARLKFNTLEWLDLLLTSCGIQPTVLETKGLDPDPEAVYETGRDAKDRPVMAKVWSPLIRWDEDKQEMVPVLSDEGEEIFFHRPDIRRKLLYLARLLPLAMKNYHMVELGPKQTGKSYLLGSLSARTYRIPGGICTFPQLFFSLKPGGGLGILGNFETALFDEIGATKFGADGAKISSGLKDYMASGLLSRGGRSIPSTCSIVFAGNIEIAPNGKGPMFPDESFFRALAYDSYDMGLASSRLLW